jgi:hypothetical protein
MIQPSLKPRGKAEQMQADRGKAVEAGTDTIQEGAAGNNKAVLPSATDCKPLNH